MKESLLFHATCMYSVRHRGLDHKGKCVPP